MRKKIPKHLKTRLLVESRRQCCLCVYWEKEYDTKSIQIAHIDKNPLNNDYDNLVVLCLRHHEMRDSKTSQSLEITQDELRYWKNLLVRTNEIERSTFDKPQVNITPELLPGQSELISNLLFLLLLDQCHNGVWGYSLGSTSGAYGRKGDPGSITVSYWACRVISSFFNEDAFREFQEFDTFLHKRYKPNGSVGVLNDVGSDLASAYEIIENRRHTAIASMWWYKFGYAVDKSLASIRYLIDTRTPTGAWSAVGDNTDGRADPVTTSYVLRALIDVDKHQLLSNINFTNNKGFIGSYLRSGITWLYSNLLDSDLWWIYRPKDESLGNDKLSQAYRFTTDVLLALPEFMSEDRVFADVHATVINNLALLWRKYKIGIPAGFGDNKPTLGTTVKFSLALWQCKNRYPTLVSELIPNFKEY